MNKHRQHHIEVRNDIERKTYRAFCRDCGWVGNAYTSRTSADQDGDMHSIAMSHGND